MTRGWVLWLLTALVACGGGGAQIHANLFSNEWEDDGGASIARVWKRVGTTPPPLAPDVAVGVTGDAGHTAVLGLPLDGSAATPWRFDFPIETRPAVAGSVVVVSGGGETVALDATHGQVLWRRPTPGLSLVGAGDDGDMTAVVLHRAGRLGSVLLAVRHDGVLLRSIESERSLGVPAAMAHLVFAPWAGEYVSVIDPTSGGEVARVTLRIETSHALALGGSLWFGELAFAHFDEQISNASKGRATTVTLPARELPGAPRLMHPGTAIVPAVAGADDKVHLYARPSARDTGAALDEGRYYATYFRVAMGFDAIGGQLAWVRLGAADVLGGAAGTGGVVLCDEHGDVASLDAKTGGLASEAHLGQALRSCVVRVDEGRIRGVGNAQPLTEALEEVVRADDPMLASAQRFLLTELATVNDASATKTFVDVASDPRTGPDLLADARAALAKRRTGAPAMEAALQRHYDYLKDVLRPPPVGPIAHALGAMKQKDAAALLAAHLLDPEDTSDDTKETAAALAVVAGPAELPAMRQFFGMYRATADDDDDDIADAVVSIGRTLIALGDPEGRAQVEHAMSDSMTVPYTRDRLEGLLAPQSAPGGDAGQPDATRDAGPGRGKPADPRRH
ncbi:MAG: PQQ-binding-like beta-propeller repeat protein [Polyangiaceae bacterium]|nr:PQQ-binding-like beta-propeller repeat protein [Polyangiaceae bacterium]